MEYTLKRAEYTDSTILFDGCQEQPLDLDISLPDYCPDIQRILKCQVMPCISGHSLNGDRLETEGTVRVRVLYLDSREDTVRCCETESGFSSVITLRDPSTCGAARVTARVEYVNCRATSPRRLDIHGAFSVCALVVEPNSQQICTCAAEEELEQKRESRPASTLAGLGEQQFTISEMLEINPGKPPVEAILRSRACCILQDFRPVSGKLLAKGMVRLEVLYSSALEDGALETMDFEIPFSQMVDCGGAEEDCRCSLHMETVDHALQIRSDTSGEAMRLEADIRVSAFACAYRDEEVTFITDAYSTRYETDLDYSQLQVSCLDELIQESLIQKISVDAGAPVARVLDVWNEILTVSGELQEGQLHFAGKINLCILAADSEEVPFYVEKMADFSLNRPWNGNDGCRVSCWAQVEGLGYRITGNSAMEITAEISVWGTASHTAAIKAVSGIHGDENRCKNEGQGILCLYYACENESLWDIARSHGVSLHSLCEENDLTDPEAGLTEGQMLLLTAQ